MKKGRYIAVLNGPNLNMLGKREPEIYGTVTLPEIEKLMCNVFKENKFFFKQSNIEGELIDWIHKYGCDEDCIGIILNAGAYSHTSLAIADSIAAVPNPVVEVHLSNIAAREEIRHRSLIAPVCEGSISGFGPGSYILAVEALMFNEDPEEEQQ